MATVTLDCAGLYAADVQGRARAFKSPVDGGMNATGTARTIELTAEEQAHSGRLAESNTAKWCYCFEMQVGW